MQQIIKSLIAAKQEFGVIVKDKTNPQYKSKYSSLDAVLAAVEPALAKHGLVITHHATDSQYITTLHCENGDKLTSSLPLPAFSDPQKLGSYLSYCRRYAVTGLLSVCSDEDDDANAAKPTNIDTKPTKSKGDPFALLRSNVGVAIKQLGWDNAQAKEWADINFGGRPSEKWAAEDWQRASRELSALVDQDMARG